MKNLLILLFLFLCSPQAVRQAAGQTAGKGAGMTPPRYHVSGYVFDSETSERLSDTYVRIGKETTLTNSYGYFNLRVEKGRQDVYVSCTGCTPYEEDVWIAGDTLLTIRLRTGVELEEVTVTAPQQHIGSSGLGNTRINLSQLYLSPLFLGERDVIKSIQALPGISGGMEGSSNIVVRGGTYDQTLFLMDDAPVYNQNHTFGFFSIFNPDALLSADIYKGGIPTVYGNRMSGVAAIALKDGNMRSHHGSVSLGLLASSLSAEGPIVKDKASYLFTARRSFTDLLMKGVMRLMTADGGDYSAVLLSFWDVNGKLTWNLNDRTRLSAGVYTGNDMLGVENETDMDREDSKRTTAYDHFGRGWKNTTASLRLTSDIRRNAFLSSSLYYSQLDNYDSYKIKSGGYRLSQRKAMRMQEMGWRTSFEQKTGNANTVFAGFDVSFQHYRPELLIREASNGNDLKIDNYRPLHLLTASVFAYDEWQYGRWTFTPGIRLSNYRTKDQSKPALEPRLKIALQAGGNHRLMLAYDRMTQPVHSINEMVYAESSSYWLPFREDRLPVSDQISAGWKNYPIPNLTLSAEVYFKQMRNIVHIQNMESYMYNHSGYRTGTGRSGGLELFAQYNPKRLHTMLSYTLSKTDRTFDGKTVPFKYDAPHEVEFSAGYEVYRTEKTKNTLSVNMQYRTGFPYTVALIRYPGVEPETDVPVEPGGYTWFRDEIDYVGSEPNIRIRDFFRTDINFTSEKKRKHGSLIWQFSILNVTARNNPYNIYRDGDRYKAFILVPFLPSLSVRREF
ncbi:MAG: TonB-dependent receptor [Tannerella sp.]|jgi:hypothetical protein|nr:TonB-dependent receptor [Tannerella sp.]